MAYDPYNAVKEIYRLKGLWDSADKAGDTVKKKAAAGDALKWYQELRANGYSAVADELQGSNYAQSKGMHDYYATTGRTKTRPYFYDLGRAYGLTASDVDKIIGFDDRTGEITLGGKNIGKPAAVVDGVSYWDDPSVLDKEFKDYADRTGLSRSKGAFVNQENENLMKRLVGEYDELKDTNPFETETGKAILAKYDLAGLQGRENQTASGAASNGGNVDSFAAANALRQQATLVNQGQMVALEAHQQKLDHARALLSDMGVHIDRTYNQDETSKNNQVARDEVVSTATGYSTDSQLKATSSLWNADGSLADTDMDYKARMDELEVLHDSATTAEEKQTYALALKLLEMGRNDKITLTGSKEPKTYRWQTPVENASTKLTKAQIESAERLVGLNTDAAIKQLDAQKNVSIELSKHGLNSDGSPVKVDTGDVITVITPDDGLSQLYEKTNVNRTEGGNYGKTEEGVDHFGARLIKAFFTKYPSGASDDDFIAFAINHSGTYATTKEQLVNVFNYLGISDAKINAFKEDYIDNPTETFTTDDTTDEGTPRQWPKGVVKKEKK